MKNYLKPYTKCTKVESEGYLLADTGQAHAGQFSKGNEEKSKTEGYSSSAKGVFFESEE